LLCSMADTKTYKSAVGIRGDCLYCPLPFSIDSYWNCEADCHHCYLRKLNRTWGQDLRPADPEQIRRKLEAGLKNKNPKTSLANALRLKKTIRFGNKTDPFQPAEIKHKVSMRILQHLIDLNWTFVIQTHFLGNLVLCEPLLQEARDKKLLTVMPVISPGAEWDWETLERKRTTPIDKRFRIMRRWVRTGYAVGVNGEPFIPGLHTTEQFRDLLLRLKDIGVESYNTYNLHLNDHVAKRFHSIGLDIEKIWTMNQDRPWRKIQKKLCEIADDVGIRLGCPDFVNTGSDWKEQANTCCGINVPNPSLFNTHYWKSMLQAGHDKEHIENTTWEGIGNKEEGLKILTGKKGDFYTMKDAGVL